MIDLRDSKQKDSKGFYKSVCCSVSQSCPTLYDPIDCIMPGFPVHHHLSEFAQTHVHWVCDAIKPSRPLSSPLPPAFSLPSIRVFSSELTFHIRWPKYWSFSFSIIPSKEIPGLISFRLSRVFSNTTVQKHQFFSHSKRNHQGCSGKLNDVFGEQIYSSSNTFFLFIYLE